jgi:dephospho-CoA kinase
VVAGGPRSGKSTLAAKLSDYYRVPVHGTDELMRLGWSESSEAASRWLERHGPWICEGVAMPRALRKFLARVPDRAPADLVIFINEAVDARIDGQETMAKGCRTVFDEILPALLATGAQVITP